MWILLLLTASMMLTTFATTDLGKDAAKPPNLTSVFLFHKQMVDRAIQEIKEREEEKKSPPKWRAAFNFQNEIHKQEPRTPLDDVREEMEVLLERAEDVEYLPRVTAIEYDRNRPNARPRTIVDKARHELQGIMDMVKDKEYLPRYTVLGDDNDYDDGNSFSQQRGTANDVIRKQAMYLKEYLNPALDMISKLGPIQIPSIGKPHPWLPRGSKEVFNVNLLLHNGYRARHYADVIYYDEYLNKVAQYNAQKLLENVLVSKEAGFKRSNATLLGENIFWTSDKAEQKSAVSIVWMAFRSWYNGEKLYKDYGKTNPVSTNSKQVDAFTAIVWRATKFMGIGFAKGKASDGSTHYVVVVNYDPPGNVRSQYKDNVISNKGTDPPSYPRSFNNWYENQMRKAYASY